MNQTQSQPQGQIPVDDAFPVYRQRCGELFDETLLLRSKVAWLERELAAAREENQRLHASAVPDGPDLAAQPIYTADDRG
ncbi:hypothetical protein [Streptomyces bottropensis]|uniref:hypothetical protein n=1 Tax=Streptomyces bottropensis TaxID=42235 RepID=UPI00367672C5